MIRESYYLFKRKIIGTVRQPLWVFMGLITPLLYLVFFSPLLGGVGSIKLTTAEVLSSFIPGLLALLAMGAGIGCGWDTLFDLKDGVIERFRVTPASRVSILMGSVLHSIVMFLVPAMVVLLAALPFGFAINAGGLAVLLLLLCLLTAIFSSWSTAMALIIKEPGSFAALVNGLQLPLILLSGMLLPLSLGPKWLEITAHINPLYYAVQASRDLANGTLFANSVVIAFIVLVPLTILATLWSTRVHRKAIS